MILIDWVLQKLRLKKFYLQGYEFHTKLNGGCVIHEQPHPTQPNLPLMEEVDMNIYDTVTFGKGESWMWKNNKFIIYSNHNGLLVQ